MTLQLMFWLLMVLWLLFGVVKDCRKGGEWMNVGGSLFMFVLMLLLGWAQFGTPFKG